LQIKKIDIARSNVVYGCLGGQHGVELESSAVLNPMGTIGCNCDDRKKKKLLKKI